MNKIKFVSYTGKYPNLCRGILTVEINGREYKFGHNCEYYNFKENIYDDEDINNPNFDAFWKSGGSIESKDNTYRHIYANEGPWELSSYSKFPDWITKILPQLLEVFNENVEYGCCGGCI